MGDGDRIDVKVGAQTGELKTGMDEVAGKVKESTGVIQADFGALEKTITAQTDRVVAALKKTGDEAKKTADQNKGVFQSMIGDIGGMAEGVLGKLAGFAAGIAAVLGGGAFLKGAVAETMEWTSTALKLSTVLGITTEEASALNLTLGELAASSLRSDITAQTLTHSLQMFVRQLATNEEGLNSYGIKTRETNGDFRNSLDIFLDALSYLRNIDGATAQNVRGTEIFKRSWGEVRPLLGLTEEALDRAKTKVKDLGIEVSGKSVEAAKEYSKVTHELGLQWDSFAIKTGTVVIPALSKMTEGVNWLLKRIGEVVTASTSAESALMDFWDAAGQGPDGAPESTGRGSGWGDDKRKSGGKLPPTPPKGGTGGGGGGAGLLAQWKEELEQLKTEENAFLDFSKEQEKKFWQDKLAQCAEGSKEYLAVRHEVFTLEKAMAQEAAQAQIAALDKEIARDKTNWDQKKALMAQEVDLAKQSYGEKSKQYQTALDKQKDLDKNYEKYQDDLAVARLDNNLKVAQMEVEGKRATLQFQRQMGQISAQKEMRSLIALKQFELQLEQQTITQKQAIRKGDEKAMEQLAQQEALFHQKKLNEMGKAEQQAAMQNKQTIESILAPIQSAIDTSVTGIIQGTTTIQKAVENLMQSILTSFTGYVGKMVLNWATNWLEMTIFGKVQNATQIASDAAVAAAAAFASTCAIPIIGPALAPEVAAASYATVMAMVPLASAAGGWDIPPGMTGYMRYHESEMVLPADLSNRIRNMTAPAPAAGGGGTQVIINQRNDIRQPLAQGEWNRASRNMRKSLERDWGRSSKGRTF